MENAGKILCYLLVDLHSLNSKQENILNTGKKILIKLALIETSWKNQYKQSRTGHRKWNFSRSFIDSASIVRLPKRLWDLALKSRAEVQLWKVVCGSEGGRMGEAKEGQGRQWSWNTPTLTVSRESESENCQICCLFALSFSTTIMYFSHCSRFQNYSHILDIIVFNG